MNNPRTSFNALQMVLHALDKLITQNGAIPTPDPEGGPDEPPLNNFLDLVKQVAGNRVPADELQRAIVQVTPLFPSFPLDRSWEKAFSFRAERPSDVDQLEKAAGDAGLDLHFTRQPITEFGEVSAEIIGEGEIEMLRTLVRGIENSQVMLQSLRAVPLRENSLTRDRNVA